MTGEEKSGGELWDAPNQQAVGLDPPWVEGTGGSSGDDGTETGGQEEESDDTSDTSELDAMTKQELLDRARSLGVTPANNDMTKEELRAGVDAKLAEG